MSKIYEALKLAQVERAAMTSRAGAAEAIAAPVVDRVTTPEIQSVIPARWPTHRLASRDDMLSLYVKVEALIGETESRAVLVMGSRPGEGATSIAREFALTIAEASSKQVLLIDANPTESSLHHLFRLPERVGLDDVARRKLGIEAAIHQLAPRNLHLARLPLQKSGGSSLLDPRALDGLFDRLRESFNDIIIDAPPVIPTNAGMVLAKRADGVVLVLAAERTRAPVVEQARRMIQANDTRLLGVVMNRRRHHIPKLVYRWL